MDKKYLATMYMDDIDTHYLSNPTDYIIETVEVNQDTVLKVDLKEGGGIAIHVKEQKQI